MKTTSNMPMSGELLRVPFAFADGLTIDGLTAAQHRLAVVLVALAAEDGSWTIAKPILERMSAIAMDNAFAILQPLTEAVLVAPVKGDQHRRHVRLFETLAYKPGRRRQTAGMVTARLSDSARQMLQSLGKVVNIPADEWRRYATMGAMVLRLRIGARLLAAKDVKSDNWRLDTDDLGSAFGVHADKWAITRKSVGGDTKSYVSLSRAAQTFFVPGADEITEVSETISIQLRALTLSDDARSRWRAIIIQSRPLHHVRKKTDPSSAAPAKPKMSDLSNARRNRLPAYAQKKASIKSEAI